MSLFGQHSAILLGATFKRLERSNSSSTADRFYLLAPRHRR